MPIPSCLKTGFIIGIRNFRKMEQEKKIKQFNKGFTLIELMVALTIFLVVSLIAASIFLTAIKNQRQAFLTQNLQDNARYIIEAMGKEVRMSRIETFVAPNKAAEETNELEITTFNVDPVAYPNGMKVYYRFRNDDDGKPVIERSEVDNNNYQPINSGQVKVEGKFYILKNIPVPPGPAGDLQPRVTIRLLLYPANASEPKVQVQNTITSRIYNE